MAKSAFKEDGMFNNAHPLVFALAKGLRKNMTHAETVLWGYLKGDFEGFRFRRRHPVSIYIADFYCHKLKLIIEADGCVHDEKAVKENDLIRENNLRSMGYTIVRFTNERIEQECDKVLEEIRIVVARLTKQY